uniref:Riboflavin biosynthesis protein n=1 Tax=candidate division WOR-3 bacterium TaxID=2052148 RepID=A0A7V0Z4S2_UNCW3
MQVLYNKTDPFTLGSVCALGNFDGIHRAHQEIINKIKKIADRLKKTGIITFHPPPVSILHKDGIFFLTTREEKEEILNSLGIDFIYYFKFDINFSQKNPEEFVNLIYTSIKPSMIIIGENFHFGKGRKGNANLLKILARDRFDVEIIPRIKDQNGVISSTRIRELLLLGHIPAANRLLGREYTITGEVIKGKGKGAKLGFPTINLSIDKNKLLPLDGVYEVKLVIAGKDYQGAMFLTHNVIEVHILDFAGNLYGQKISIKLVKRLRAIKKFPDDESLKRAIADDIKRIKNPKI